MKDNNDGSPNPPLKTIKIQNCIQDVCSSMTKIKNEEYRVTRDAGACAVHNYVIRLVPDKIFHLKYLGWSLMFAHTNIQH